MSLYVVLVAHNGLRVNDFVSTDDGERFARLGYLKKIEEVHDEPGDSVAADSPGGDDAPKRRRGRKAKASEVTGEPDSTESPAGPPDGEEQGA